MKKSITLILTVVMLFTVTSCLEDYLNKAPESGLSEDEIFTKYDNFKQFFYSVYEGRKYYSGGWRDYNIKTAFPLYFVEWDQKYSWEGVTDAADQGRYMEGHTFKSGQVSAFINKFTYDGKRRPILESMFMCIRTANMALEKIDLLQDASPEDKDDLIAQAHFVRAFCHFELMRLWGPMPYLTKPLGPDDQWDIPRLSKYETLKHVAMDMDTAAMYFEKAGRMRRDLGPGQPGHLNHPDQARPNGVAAKAYKGRALLYAASPLNNDQGITAWEDAAKANWEAIQIALQYQYSLLSAADYKKNYVGTTYTNEELWAWHAGNLSWNNGAFQGLLCGIIGNSKSSWSGVCPTQNFVDKFETKWGDPLNTQADRDAAAALGHYNEQDPYANLDPRFYIDILYNQASVPGYKIAQIWREGSDTYGELLDPTYLGRSHTGYMIRKTWGEASNKN
ncbi:MAG TPA: RagB/SusD family nutrient uptake outer membrane protein, partial [Chryseosolibacter sp.]|nr:RagB/SusD family nutrient uptake outer membrane protein [Chryseosolibacter sp.]